MQDNWYYVSQKKKFGPCTFQQLKDLAAAGSIGPADMVLPPPGQTWAPASSVPGLFAADSPRPKPVEALAALVKKVPRWAWFAAVPTVIVLFCCGGVGLFAVFSWLRPGPQPVTSQLASASPSSTKKARERKENKDPNKGATKETPSG